MFVELYFIQSIRMAILTKSKNFNFSALTKQKASVSDKEVMDFFNRMSIVKKEFPSVYVNPPHKNVAKAKLPVTIQPHPLHQNRFKDEPNLNNWQNRNAGPGRING